MTFGVFEDMTRFVLVGGLDHFLFFHILGIIIPTDFHMFQRGGSTTNQISVMVKSRGCADQSGLRPLFEASSGEIPSMGWVNTEQMKRSTGGF